jgi:hypothetical protein
LKYIYNQSITQKAAYIRNNVCTSRRKNEEKKGVWGMPRLSEAKKDVISCEKLR